MTFMTSNGKPVSQFSACRTKPFEPASEHSHTAEAKIDFVYPEVPFPTNALYKTWGAENIRAMVRYHHGLLRKSTIGDLFPADFFVEALGGEQAFTPVHGHPALRMRHFHITIDEKGREIWLMMYKKTINDLAIPSECVEEFWNWIEPLSIRMINRRTTVAPVERHSYSSIWVKQ